MIFRGKTVEKPKVPVVVKTTKNLILTILIQLKQPMVVHEY